MFLSLSSLTFMIELQYQIGEHAYDLDEFGHPVYTTSADESLLAARLRDACVAGNLPGKP